MDLFFADPTQPPPGSSSNLWPHIPGRYEPYGVDRMPPGVLQSHYHHLYMQQQQLRYYQGLGADPLSSRMHLPPRPDMLHHIRTSSPSCSMPSRRLPFNPNKEPETITVSDDDDEQPTSALVTPSTSTATIVPPPSSTIASSSPSQLSSKSKLPNEEEIAIDLAKTSPVQNTAVSKPKQIKTPPPLTQPEKEPQLESHEQLSMNIKQERSEEVTDEMKLIAESLLDLSTSHQIAWQPQKIKVERLSVSEFKEDQFGALLRGIELHEQSKDGIDMLCAVTHEEASTQVSYDSSHLLLSSRFDVLCCVTKRDKIDLDDYIDPIILLRQQFNLRQHQTSPEAIQSFIQTKAQYYKRLQDSGQDYEQDPEICPSLSKIIKKIKNTEFMSDLEIELRNQLLQLQEDYKEKQSQLSRFKSPKKRFQKKKGQNKRKPPKRLTPKRRNSSSPALSKGESSSPVRAPPRLEPSSPPRLQNSAAESWKQSSALLKPPKLTASLTPQKGGRSSVTNLSTINQKFMKGKANPFANLLSKLASTSTSGTTSPVKTTGTMADIEEEEEEGTSTTANENEDDSAGSKDDVDDDETETDTDTDDDEYTFDVKKAQYGNKRGRSSSVEDSSSSKKRKAEKPKKQSGTTETIVPKKPKNLFMMNCYEFENGFMSQEEKEISAPSPTKRTQSPVKAKKSNKVSITSHS